MNLLQSFPSGNSKVRSASGFALFAYQVPNASEVVHLLPVNGTGSDENAKTTTSNVNKLLGDASSTTTANRAAKVYQMKGVTTASSGLNTSEVRRPVGICMNVMSTMFCRKVFRSLFHLLFSSSLLEPCRLVCRPPHLIKFALHLLHICFLSCGVCLAFVSCLYVSIFKILETLIIFIFCPVKECEWQWWPD